MAIHKIIFEKTMRISANESNTAGRPLDSGGV